MLKLKHSLISTWREETALLNNKQANLCIGNEHHVFVHMHLHLFNNVMLILCLFSEECNLIMLRQKYPL